VINQKLGYLVRGGDPDAIDSIVPMAFGNLALDLILKGYSRKAGSASERRYDNVPIDVVTSTKKLVDIRKHYNTDRLRPIYESFEMKPLFLMTGYVHCCNSSSIQFNPEALHMVAICRAS
jgi:ATP-dependent phosphofructokinase / diphosphate-dependent phosphofructokinase